MAYLAGEADTLQLQEMRLDAYRRHQLMLNVSFSDDGARVDYKQYFHHNFEFAPAVSLDSSQDSSSNASEIVCIVAEFGPQMMRWVNGLNSVDMKAVTNNNAVLTFLATGPEVIASLGMADSAYNGLFIKRSVSQWALGYPSLLAGLGLGSNYTNVCAVDDGLNENLQSLAFPAVFLTVTSYPMFLYGDAPLTGNVMDHDDVRSPRATLYDSEGALQSEYTTKYEALLDIEPGTGRAMRTHKRLVASYALPPATSNVSQVMGDGLWQVEALVPAYWGEEGWNISDSRVDNYEAIMALLNSLLPELIVGLVDGVLGVGAGFFVMRRRPAKSDRRTRKRGRGGSSHRAAVVDFEGTEKLAE
ncbi:hypothetical protein BBJ28_00007132 [Nothophytophthora sp. Chile5]|nr:hypothetical protein BBJ28_00007132 [Nothophytophthora sp. Chile5]